MIKKAGYVMLLAMMISCGNGSLMTKSEQKVKKGAFVMNEQDSIFDIVATDTYDSISFVMNLAEGALWDITVKELAQSGDDDRWEETGYMGAVDSRYCFHRKGYADSDTLYGWQINLLNEKKILLNNEGNQLKIFGKDYGQKVSLFTPEGKLIEEKKADKATLDFHIPSGYDYLKVDITRDSDTHVVFNFPVR
ncbi:MAG: hypothetical protein J6T94_03125 [Bacteroidaceae bacterium]|nr:hypothetical protein [Bacteroidaceae bacterium]